MRAHKKIDRFLIWPAQAGGTTLKDRNNIEEGTAAIACQILLSESIYLERSVREKAAKGITAQTGQWRCPAAGRQKQVNARQLS